MKAAIRKRYCGPEQLLIQNVSLPVLKADEILVKVKATTVNRTDCGVLTGKPYAIRLFTGLFRPYRAVTGTDFAGVVVEVGSKVSTFEVGDQVYGFYDQGLETHAEYVAVSSSRSVMKKPDNVTFEQAVASLEGAHYAYYFLKGLPVKAGDRILINGGTGAIGNAALQLLKHLGVHVTVTCEAEYVSLLKARGADRVIDYLQEDFTTLEEKFPYIFDAVGKSSFQKCKPLLEERGIYISSELGDNWENPLLGLFFPLMRGKRVKFPIPYSIKESMEYFKNLVEQGEFVPLIDRRYKFSDIRDAFLYVQSGRKKGNVVLSFS
jgi:NADPH:quinone reductase-like Zn-dependent oxidoreductase